MDLWRFAGVFVVCLLAAIVTQQYMVVFVVGFSLFFVWQYLVLLQLLRWLKKEKEISPRQAGVVHNICREIINTRVQYQRHKAKLSTYLKQYQDAISAIPDAVILLGPYDTIDWANKKADEFLGIKWPQDGGLPITSLIRSPQLKQYLDCQDEAILQAGLQMVPPSRPRFRLECFVIRYGVQQKLLIVHDTTVIHRAHQMRRNFVANASHELRTPLTVISGYLEGLADSVVQCPPEWLPRIEQMRKQANRMQRLIEDLLLLSDLEGRVADETDQLVNVPDMLASIQQEAQPLDCDAQHVFRPAIESLLWIKGNQHDLHSTFSNLIGNAVQHTPAGTLIHIRWYRDVTGAHFEVSDNGPGIAPEHLSRLTERFYRVGPSSSTGLGLSIVRHALARNAATLHIESQPSIGSCFRCDFPLSSIVMQPDSAAP